MHPQPGDYGVVDSRPTGGGRFISASIRLLTRSPWSHAYVVVDGGMVVEGHSKGARLALLEEYDGQEVAYNDLEPKTPEQRSTIVHEAHALVGTRYNFLDILALALVGLGIHWGWPARRACRKDRMICSQLVATCYARAGIPVSTKAAQLVTPGDLGLRLDERPWELSTK